MQCKHAALSSDPQDPCKNLGVVTYAVTPAGIGWEEDTGVSLEPIG